MSKLVIPGVVAQTGNGGGSGSITPISPLQYQTTSEVVTETVPYNIYYYPNLDDFFDNPELQPTPYTSDTIIMTEDDLDNGLLFEFNKGYQPQLTTDFRITGKFFVLNNPSMDIYLNEPLQELADPGHYYWNENNLIDFYRYDEGDPITVSFHRKDYSTSQELEELEIPCSEITGNYLLYEIYYDHINDKVTFTFKQSDETLIGSTFIENFSTKVELSNKTSVNFWTNDIDYPEPIDGIYKFETIEVKEVTTKNLELNYDDNTLAVTDGELTVIGGGGGDSVIKDYEAPSYTVNTTLFNDNPLAIPNLDALTEAGTYRVHFDIDMDEGITTTVTYIADVAPIKTSDTPFAYIQNLYVGPGHGDSVSIVRSGASNNGSITWSDWSGNSLFEKQDKTLSTTITVGGVSQTTVEGALGAINANTDGALKNTATGTDSIGILIDTNYQQRFAVGIGKGARLGYYGVTIGRGATSGENATAIGAGSTATQYGVSVGYAASTGSGASRGIAIGYAANANAANAIQLGQATNSTASTFQVYSYPMLDGNTGKIPMARLPIVQISQADYDALVLAGTVDANTLYLIV